MLWSSLLGVVLDLAESLQMLHFGCARYVRSDYEVGTRLLWYLLEDPHSGAVLPRARIVTITVIRKRRKRTWDNIGRRICSLFRAEAQGQDLYGLEQRCSRCIEAWPTIIPTEKGRRNSWRWKRKTLDFTRILRTSWYLRQIFEEKVWEAVHPYFKAHFVFIEHNIIFVGKKWHNWFSSFWTSFGVFSDRVWANMII